MFPLLTGSDISDFIHNLESQDIKVEMMKQSNYRAAAPHSTAFNVTGTSKVTVIFVTFLLEIKHSMQAHLYCSTSTYS